LEQLHDAIGYSLVTAPNPSGTAQSLRIAVSIAGRYSLASRRDAAGHRRWFACRAVSLSISSAAFAAPVFGGVGEWVTAHVDRLGQIEGPISRLLERGFMMDILTDRRTRARLTERLLWIEKHKNLEVPDNRRHPRRVPEDPHSVVTLADGRRLNCFVIDISASGAAISLDLMPQIGMPLAVGRLVARVVRQLPHGFAVKFLEDQDDPEQLERLILAA
jgi:hypothetical protein